MKSERRFNLRPLLFFAISIICGEVACYYSPALNGYGALILVAAFLLFFIVSELFWKSRSRVFRLTLIGICLFLSLCGYGRFYLSVLKTEAGKVAAGKYEVCGVVGDVSVVKDGKAVLLSSCTYDGEKGGDILFYGLDGLTVGDRISVKCRVYPADSDFGGKYSYSTLIGASMRGADATSLVVTGYDGGVFYSLRRAIRNGLISGGDGLAPKIALALTVGDTSELTFSEICAFRLSGIAHIFAVSGMHIGLLFAAFSFLAKPLPVKRWLKNSVIFLMLVLYAGVCGFSSSSLRAAIMSGCFLLSDALGEKHDKMNALSLAAIIISLASPASVVGVGFILSFTVCFSLITISPPISRKTAFLGGKFSYAVSAIVAAELAIYPISVVYFGYMPILSPVLNLLVLPVVTIAYYLLWIGLLLNAIFPFLSVGLVVPYAVINGIYFVAEAAALGGMITEFPKTLLLPYYAAFVVTGDLVNVERQVKIIGAGFMSAIAAVSVLASFI